VSHLRAFDLFRARGTERSVPPRREVDVVAPEHDLQRNQPQAEGDAGPKRVDLRPGLHDQSHREQSHERGGASQEEAEWPAFRRQRFDFFQLDSS
jgi:hypothetical protein